MNVPGPLRAGALLLVLAVAVSGCSGTEEDRRADEAATRSATPPSDTPEPPEPTDQPGQRESGLPEELAAALEHGPRPATSPRQAVEQIVAAERAIEDPQTRPQVLAAAGHLQQVAYRVLGRTPAWDDRVRKLVPGDLRRVVADNVAARRQLRSMHPTSPGELSDELPAWRIVAPPPKRRLLAGYRDAERAFRIPWTYLAAINLVETAMGRIQGTSVAGAQGPMQFMPGTWAAYGQGDVHDPHDAIMGAGRYLRAMGFAEDRATALRRYNNHPAYVRAVTLLAEVMARRPRAFDGYYHWNVYYLTSKGSIRLPVGYAAEEPIPVERWLARQGAT